jgi:hypothetical protein
MEVPAPDPSKLLQSWREWERGEVTPGRVVANMKTGGLRQLLEELSGAAVATGSPQPGAPKPEDVPGTATGPSPTRAPVV